MIRILIILQILFTPEMCWDTISVGSDTWASPDYVVEDYLDIEVDKGCEYQLLVHFQMYSVPDAVTLYTEDEELIIPYTGQVGGDLIGFYTVVDGVYIYTPILDFPLARSPTGGAFTLKHQIDGPCTLRIYLNTEYSSYLTLLFECSPYDTTIVQPSCIDSVYQITYCDTNFTYQLVNTHAPRCYPNIFSPNGDGHNDFIQLDEPFQVYDRWGNLIYEGYKWEGRSSAEGVYTINTPHYVGTVTLVR